MVSFDLGSMWASRRVSLMEVTFGADIFLASPVGEVDDEGVTEGVKQISAILYKTPQSAPPEEEPMLVRNFCQP